MNKQFLEILKPEAVNEMRFNFKTSFKLVIYLIDTKASPPSRFRHEYRT